MLDTFEIAKIENSVLGLPDPTRQLFDADNRARRHRNREDRRKAAAEYRALLCQFPYPLPFVELIQI